MRRLYPRIYLHFLGVLAVVGVATSVVLAWSAREAFRNDLGERMGRHVAHLVSERLDDGAALTARLAELHAELDVDLTVRDLDGRVVASTGRIVPRLANEPAREGPDGRVALEHTRRGMLVAVRVDDPTSGAPRGTVTAALPHRFRPAGLLRPLLVVAMMLGVVAIAVGPLARRISRPIERLTAAARRLGGGDLGARVPLPSRASGWWRRHRGPGDELAELSRAFNDMAARVERLVRGQKELLANVSHELRSPLARIRLALELLPHDDASAAHRADLERDLAEIDRLIDDVLTAARLEATGLPAQLAPVDVNALLDEIGDRARRDPGLAGWDVRVVAGPPTRLLADELLLKRALWNLVDNARKYGAPPLTLSAVTREGHAEISVADDGPGIPAEDRAQVFNPFFRRDPARSPDRGGGGVGLGLTLAQRVVEVHGGAIRVEPASTVHGGEHGCRVVMVLPIERPAGAPVDGVADPS